jgi:hypothetical protein
MSIRFLGQDFQINSFDSPTLSGILGNQGLPRVTTLSDGRFAAVYESEFQGDSTDFDIVGAVFAADGSPSTPIVKTIYGALKQQLQPVDAALPGGGFGTAFYNQLHADGTLDANGLNIIYERVSATGVAGTPLAIGDLNGTGSDTLFNPAIATLSTGRQVVRQQRQHAC